MSDLKALSDSLLATIKSFVERKTEALMERLGVVERTLADLPVPKDGVTPGPEVLQPLVDASVERAVAAIPVPKDGVTPGPEVLEPLVAKAVAALPPAEPGHTPTLEELQPLVDKAVGPKLAQVDEALSAHATNIADAIKAIPVPKDGVTPGPEVLEPLVAKAVAALPPAEPGHTPTPEELQPLVDKAVEGIGRQFEERVQQRLSENNEGVLGRVRAVENALTALPVPKDGHTPTPEELQPLVAAAVKALPPAEPGKSVTPDDVRPMLVELVAEATLSAAPEALQAHIKGLLTEMLPAIAAEAAKAMPKPLDGRDALDLNILAAINTEKSYPRGTFAKHNGGLWRSFEATDGMRGWECIVEGAADVQVEQQGDRKFVVTTTTSSGKVSAKEFTVPVMIYRGIYREDQTYDVGDTVTWGGSTWTCKQVTADKPGQSPDSWALSVKKGRDGKDTEGVKL